MDDSDQRSQTLRLFAHDLSNPLTAIRILVEMLQDDLTDPQLRGDLADVLEAADLAGVTVDSLSSYARLGSDDDDPPTAFTVDLGAMMQRCTDRAAFRKVTVRAARDVQVLVDDAGLQRALTEVLLLTRKLAEPRGQVEVDVWVDGADAVVRFTVVDGSLAEPFRERLFVPFGALELREARIQVPPAGLVFARTIARRHGGDLTFEPGEALVLTMRLPLL